jgi:peroxiredoxin Q/BCP
MNRALLTGLLVLAAAILTPGLAAAQETESTFLGVGEPAPDFELVGATRYGVLEEPVRLSDFRGETVILAFFFRARTPG